MGRAKEVLEFWFGTSAVDADVEFREAWFKVDPAFDAEIEASFGADARAAAEGGFDDWLAGAGSSLALCILLDQFPRNLFRGSGQAFATDAKAREVARTALEKGFDKQLAFMHSEDIADQIRSVELYRALGNESQFRYALDHHYVISRFGRFPTRNAALGRDTTAEEAEFLKGFNAF
jgi:uncharacterized protein (DUF924 family)